MAIYKIFCDESCHLEHDGADIMAIGAIHCSAEKAVELSKAIKALRHKHNYLPELKWSKLNKQQWIFYQDLIDLILDDDEIYFKATIVMNKHLLNHTVFNAGSHNNFYYKVLYYTLRDFLSKGNEYRIYLDYMDTLGADKSKKLCEVLQAGTNWKLKVDVTIIQSYQVQITQLCDLLVGAVAYRNRTDIEHKSAIKNQFVAYLEQKIGHRLDITTVPWERQFNIFRMQPQGQKRC
ncbi:DUF3800 domain-containing protein [Mannheimia indoligenes]|uniref:DUF3800 domain-containing protein n=1 Tax=Mannheimia indoligenes TaxID=3103145 RepID=UPI002FE69907